MNHNTYKKSSDKADMEQYNSRLDQRNFEISRDQSNNNQHNTQRDVNRLLDERNMFTENGEQSQGSKKNNKINKSRTGEITGDTFDFIDADHGMPLRSQYNTKKNHTDLEEQYNKHRDSNFNIYDDSSSVDFDVSYYDPHSSSTNMCDLKNLSSKIIGKSPAVNNQSIVSDIINEYNWDMFKGINRLDNEGTFYYVYGIIKLMGILYNASTAETETSIKNYFNFQDKNIVFSGLSSLENILKKSKCCNFTDFLLINKQHRLDNRFLNNINNLVKIQLLNPQNAKYESHNFTLLLNKTYNNYLGNIISDSQIQKLSFLCLSVGLIRSEWKLPFSLKYTRCDQNLRSNALVFKNNTVASMYNVGKSYKYFEDNMNQILEIPMTDNILSMGIILPKGNIRYVSLKEFAVCTTNMTMTCLDEVSIPCFKLKSKMRISNMFKKTGLGDIFDNMVIPEFTNETTCLTDFVQNIYVIVDNNYKLTSESVQQSGVMSKRKFIVDKPFTWYFKLNQTNTILVTGIIN